MRLTFLLLALAACGGTAAVGSADGPYELDGALAYLDVETGAVVVVDPTGTAGPDHDRYLHRIEVAARPLRASSLPRPDDPQRRQLVVLDPGNEEIVVVHDKHGDYSAIDLGLPFDAFEVSPDGGYAIAYQPQDAGPQHSLFAFPNAIAIVELGAEAKATALRLPSSSARPRRAAFAATMQLRTTLATASGPLTLSLEAPLALVFVEGGVVPVDLAQKSAGAMIPLGSLEDVVVPQEVVFTNNAGDALAGAVDGIERAFVRGDNGELYVLSITVGPGPSGAQAFVTLENVVTPDTFVFDIELYFDADGKELLLAAAGNELILVDGYTGVASRFAQDTWVDTLARFVDPASSRAMALGYGRHREAVLLRLDPLSLAERRASGLTVMPLAGALLEVTIAEAAGRAVLRYDDWRTLGVLDLTATGQVLDVQMADSAQASALAPGGNRMLLVGRSPVDDEPHLAEVVLAPALTTQDVRLDAQGAQVGVVGGHVFVDHGEEGGSVTFFPDGSLKRSAAISFSAVLYTDIFDAEVQQ